MRLHTSTELPVQLRGTLVIATEGPGQVGQLAADLLMCTWQARRVGWLQEPALLPAVGASDSTPGALAMALELYQLSDGVALLQQRAPAAPGMQQAYAERLAAWVAEAGFSEVLLLGSLDAALRRDEQLSGKQLRFWSPAAGEGGAGDSSSSLAQRCAAVGLPPLEQAWFAERPMDQQLLPPWPAAVQLQLQGQKVGGLAAVLAFAAEGENREAAAPLAAAAAAAAGLVAADGAAPAWRPPPSWQWAVARPTAVY